MGSLITRKELLAYLNTMDSFRLVVYKLLYSHFVTYTYSDRRITIVTVYLDRTSPQAITLPLPSQERKIQWLQDEFIKTYPEDGTILLDIDTLENIYKRRYTDQVKWRKDMQHYISIITTSVTVMCISTPIPKHPLKILYDGPIVEQERNKKAYIDMIGLFLGINGEPRGILHKLYYLYNHTYVNEGTSLLSPKSSLT